MAKVSALFHQECIVEIYNTLVDGYGIAQAKKQKKYLVKLKGSNVIFIHFMRQVKNEELVTLATLVQKRHISIKLRKFFEKSTWLLF